MAKYGPLGWDNALADGARRRMHAESGEPVQLRLFVHGVADDTNLGYLKEVRRFLGDVSTGGYKFDSFERRDYLLAIYLDDMCYQRSEPVSRGSKLFNGFMHVFPEHRGRMTLSARAIACWERLAKGAEGGPAWERTVYAIAADMLSRGLPGMCVACLLALDCFLREQDWEQLLKEDVYHTLDEQGLPVIALKFGRRHRAERVKTGQEQGVTIDSLFLKFIMLARLAQLRDDERVFPFSQASFRAEWGTSLLRLDLPFVGPPHSLRHSGPSRDAASGARTLEEIRRRGRWSQLKSVQRYSKGHELTVHKSRLPEAILRQGEKLLHDPITGFTELARDDNHRGSASLAGLHRAQAVAGQDVGNVRGGRPAS